MKKRDKDFPYNFEKFANCVHSETEYREKYIQLICWSRNNAGSCGTDEGVS